MTPHPLQFMTLRTTRSIAPLLVAHLIVLVASLGVMSPVLGVINVSWGEGATAAGSANISCCGDDCQCGAHCPCVERAPLSEPTSPPFAPVETRGFRALCLAVPINSNRIELLDPVPLRLNATSADVARDARPAGRELLARVSKWTT